MKKIFLGLIFTFNLILAQTYTPEYYENQLQVLRNLDIHPSYISDLHLIQTRSDLVSKHSAVLVRSVKESAKLTPMIRAILAAEDVPEEILFLAMVESGLKSNSISNAKAVGVWQFMKPTAKKLGLRIDAYVDERRDLVKSTHAAANYLKKLKAKFGKWYLAILAYNCGDGKLSRAIKQAGSDDLKVLLDPDKKYLPLETRNFLRKILTFASLANDKDFLLSEDASSLMNYSFYNDFVKVDVPSSVSLKDLARGMQWNLQTLKLYNPQFKHSFTPPGDGYYMYIPLGKVSIFNTYFKNTQFSKVDTRIPMTKTYIVKSGDSLYSIAKKYKISIAEIKEFNKIRNNNLSINQKLILPIKDNKNAAYQKTKNSYTQVVSR